MQPFDSKSLHHLLATEDVNEDDIKFISWDSFDIALENDEGLFMKLLSLVDDEQSMPMLAQKLAQDTFIPLMKPQSPAESNFYYRISRGGTQHNWIPIELKQLDTSGSTKRCKQKCWAYWRLRKYTKRAKCSNINRKFLNDK